MREIKIGTRGSLLALYQANLVRDIINKIPGYSATIVVIDTKGDKDLKLSLSSNKLTKGLFTKEIEDKLSTQEIDFAVHSLKDLPVDLDEQFCLASVLQRDDVRDVLIANKPISNIEDCANWTIGTSSPRREAQLRAHYSHLGLSFQSIRGNVQTRLSKLQLGLYDGIIMAKAGVDRLNLGHHITHIFSLDDILPAPGQAAIAIETHINNKDANELASAIEDKELRKCIHIERHLLKSLGGGCALPFGCYAINLGDGYRVRAFYSDEVYSRCVHHTFNLSSHFCDNQIESQAQSILKKMSM